MISKIITDAGFETLSYSDALPFFTKEVIQEWWLKMTEEWEKEELFKELGVTLDPNNEEDLESFYENYDCLPKDVTFVCAKAVYGKEKWLEVIELTRCTFADFYEEKAILLGAKLRDYLQQELLIINDNKNAVKKLKPTVPNLLWQRRTKVQKAHDLKVGKATKIFS